MADDANNDAEAHRQPPQPNPDLKNLGERLVGTWEMSGEVGEGSPSNGWRAASSSSSTSI